MTNGGIRKFKLIAHPSASLLDYCCSCFKMQADFFFPTNYRSVISSAQLKVHKTLPSLILVKTLP